jgi:predicted  nucleic acid-binding Zn-ribbon protein
MENFFDMSNVKMISIECSACKSNFDVVFEDDVIDPSSINHCVVCGATLEQDLPEPEELDNFENVQVVQEDIDDI